MPAQGENRRHDGPKLICSASLNEITKGGNRHPAGWAYKVIRKMKAPEAAPAKSRQQGVTLRNKEPNHRSMRRSAFVKQLAPEINVSRLR
jgi:hypothetical protein